jgi:cytochrome c
MSIVRRSFLAAALLGAALLQPAFAQERGSKEEARALNDAAVAHIKKVGLDQAMKDFAADRKRWMPKDLYPFVMEFGGVMRFHISDKLMGRNSLDVKDAAGKEFAREMVAVAAKKGNGWVDYEWPHPVSKKVEDKSAFIQRVPGADMFVGVGVYR